MQGIRDTFVFIIIMLHMPFTSCSYGILIMIMVKSLWTPVTLKIRLIFSFFSNIDNYEHNRVALWKVSVSR